MAKIIYKLSKKIDKSTGKSEIIFRFRVGRGYEEMIHTHVYILPKFFADGKIVVKNRVYTPEVKDALISKAKAEEIENHLATLSMSANQEELVTGWGQDKVERLLYPELYEIKDSREMPFMELFDKYINESDVAEARKNRYRVLKRMLQRYEIYKGINIELETLNDQIIEDFRKFIKDEHTLFRINKDGKRVPAPKYKIVMELLPETRIPEERSDNTIVMLMKLLKGFIHWCVKKGYITDDPSKNVSLGSEKYGTPFYLNEEERNQVYKFDLSHSKHLSNQRDVFIFQCYIGCRVSDMYSMTHQNIIEDKNGLAIEYIPHKTKDKKAQTVKVYLAPTAIEIYNRYKGECGDKLLPLISQQKYNDAIKEVLKACGIDRMVPVLNSLTGEVEMKCIADVASSHMARRTFIGNLYKKVKDPNLVGKLSGHTEGSRAFARYRDIDDDMIKDLTDLL